MATYFHGNTSSEIESSAEGLQTLYLMNPNYVPYSDAPNMLLVNPNSGISAAAAAPANALNLANFSHAPPPSSANNHHHHHQQHLVGFTIPSSNILGSTTTTSTTSNSNHLGQHGISGGFQSFADTTTPAVVATNPRTHYNLWGSIINQTMSSATTAVAETTPSNHSGYSAAVTVTDDSGHHNRGNRQGGLSLSLSSQQQSFRSLSSGEIDVPVRHGPGSGVVLRSKYLKAAQEVLDEAVNVGKGICEGESMEGAKSNKEKMRANIESETSGIGENSGSNKQGAELSMAQRQELQMKKSKLVSMLDEVELRYRQYHNQMDMVISSFEQGAGYGAAKSYTALALKTISKQFRCLKDAISSQIKTASKTLGDQDGCLGAKVEGSRLRYVDHHLRQQRALQQLGMIQHNAWRPQRGLPERAVSVLRAWLFEHFLHPYPKDSDKVMLAKQTGLTRSQVSNWFINARVRLWKPMVEEMYLEEIKEQEQNNDNTNRSAKDQSSKELWSTSATNAPHESSSCAIKLDHQINAFHSKEERLTNNQNTSPTEISNSDNNSLSTSPIGGGSFQSQYSGFHLAESSSEIQIRSSPKKPRSSEMQQHFPGSMDMEMKPVGEETREANTEFDTERHNKDDYPLMTSGNENHGGGYGGAFSMDDIGRFNVTDQLAPRFHGNGVSLTLGLPHNDNLPLSASQHGFLPQNMHLGGRLEMGTNENEFCAISNTAPPSSHSGTSYENIDIQNRKRFAAQLLRNFVA